MDTRRLLTTLVIVGAVMIAYPYISRLWNHPKPPAPAIPASPLYATSTAPGVVDIGAAKEFTLGDPTAASNDKVSVVVTNLTAGIKLVQLNVKNYSQDVKSKAHPIPQPLTLMSAVAGEPLPYSTIGIHVTLAGAPYEIPLVTSRKEIDALTAKGTKANLDERDKRIHDDNSTALYSTQDVWKLVSQSPTEVQFVTFISDVGPPVVKITKTFHIDPATYEVRVSHTVENLTKQPMTVAIDQMAAIDLPLDQAQLDDRFYHAASLNSAKKVMKEDRSNFNMAHAELKKWDNNSKEVGSFIGTDPLEWIASSGRFFVAITRPLPETGAPADIVLDGGHKIGVATHVGKANIDRLIEAEDPANAVAAIRLMGNALEIAPGVPCEMPLTVYFGPKRQDILQGNINAATNTLPYQYAVYQYVRIIQISSSSCFGIYQYCFIDALAYYMLRFLDFLKSTVAFGNYGIAIILMVFMVKALLHPLTKKSQINMAVMGKKMKDIQPLIEANKKKYAKDKAKQNEEMMRIYKEKNVNPAGGIMGCLPMLLQTPIWIAVWEGLRADIALRHAAFIPGWINDLSAPDATIPFAHPVYVPLLSSMMGPLHAFNLLPLLLGIVVFVQMKVQSASQPRSADPQQAQMQKMSQYMVLIFPLFLYNMPSGINLYYFASTLGGLVDTYVVRKSLKRQGILPTNAPALPTHEEKDEPEVSK